MTILKLIPLLITMIFLSACGSDNVPSKKIAAEKPTDILFDAQKKVLDDAKNVEKVLADEEQKRKDKLNELGL